MSTTINNTNTFNAPVGQFITNVEVLNASFDKDGTMQITNAEKVNTIAPNAKTATARKKAISSKVTSATFHYVYFEQQSALVAKLFQGLLSLEWIAKDSDPNAFMEIFAGKDSNSKIKWIGTRQHLAYLFNLLTKRKYITIPKGASKWVIVCSHFVDKNSRQFINMNKLSKPKKAEKAIDMLAEALNPAGTINKAES